MRNVDEIRREHQSSQAPLATPVRLQDIDLPFGLIFRLVLLVSLAQAIVAILAWLLFLFVTRVAI